jgi:hypothetical protein
MMMRSRIQRRIGRCWLITGVCVVLASCGGMTQPNFAHTNPWLGGTVTYTAVSGDPGITVGATSPLEGEFGAPTPATCAEALDAITHRRRPLSVFGARNSETTLAVTGPFVMVAIDPNDRFDDHVSIFNHETGNTPTSAELALMEQATVYVVDEKSLDFERSSDDQLIARLSATNALEMSVELRLDLVCHLVP